MLEHVAEEDRVEAPGEVLRGRPRGGPRAPRRRRERRRRHPRRPARCRRSASGPRARAQGRRGRSARATHVEDRGGAVRHPGREVVARGGVHGAVAVHVGSGIDRRRTGRAARPLRERRAAAARGEALRGPIAARQRRATTGEAGTRSGRRGRRDEVHGLREERRRQVGEGRRAPGLLRIGFVRDRKDERQIRARDRARARAGGPARAAGRPPGRPGRARSAHPPRRRRRRGSRPGASVRRRAGRRRAYRAASRQAHGASAWKRGTPPRTRSNASPDVGAPVRPSPPASPSPRRRRCRSRRRRASCRACGARGSASSGCARPRRRSDARAPRRRRSR